MPAAATTVNDASAPMPDVTILRSFAEHISALVAYWDKDLRCGFANRAYKQWFGRAAETLIGTHIRDLLGPELYELNRPFIEGALRGEAQTFERDIPDPAGGPPRHSHAQYIPHLEDGEVHGFFVLVTDISEVKRAQRALADSEERFRLTIDEAPIGMALVAPDGRFLRVNHALCEIVGYAPEELKGLTFQAITHPEDLNVDLALADKLARGEIPRYSLAKRYIRKNGSIVHIMLSGSVVREPSGAPRYFIAQIEDVTEQRLAQQAVQQSQERLELALSGTDLASWDWNVTTGDVVYDVRWARMLGYRTEDVAPRIDSWRDLIHPDDRPNVDEAIAAHFAGRTEVYETEHRLRTRSGDWIWILDRGKVFARDAGGAPLRMAGTSKNITERKRAERDQNFLADVGLIFARSLDYEETLAKLADVAVKELADFCIVDVIDAESQLHRLDVAVRDPESAWLAQAMRDFPVDRTKPYVLASVLRTRTPLLLQRPSEESITAFAQNEEHLRLLRASDIGSLVAVPLVARGTLLGAIAFLSRRGSRVYDEKDVRLAEELANRAALAIDNAQLYRAARRATKARDDVLGVVAHDLRNPLNSIALESAYLSRTTGDEDRARSGEAIARAAKRMNRLIEDLLDVSRLDAGHMKLVLDRVSPQRVVLDGVESQRSLAEARDIRLTVDVGSEVPDLVADRDRLLQVFENLIGNAIKFTGAGGRIVVGSSPLPGQVLFFVRDSGGGIAEEDLPHVFDRFWQGARKRHGAGLGLPIVKGIIDAHGGRVWVESKLGEGTTFFFTIPSVLRVGSASLVDAQA